MKRIICVLLLLFLSVNLIACSANQTAEQTITEKEEVVETNKADTADTEAEAEESATRLWTDSVGREVEVPAHIDKIALSGPNTQIVAYAFAPEKLAGFSGDWSKDVQQYIPAEYLSLPVLGQLYGGKEEINLEELLASGAQIVIDIGEPKSTIVEDLDALQEQLGIPFVHITMTLEGADEGFRMLGDLLGLEDRAEEYASYCSNVYARGCEIVKKAEADGGRKNALYVLGDQGLNVIAKDSFHGEVFDMFTNNLAVVDEPTAKGSGNEVDMEQMLIWNPDWIIFAPESIYGDVADRGEWQSITAIKEGNYVETPFGPYNWMGFPPSCQRYLGILWLPYVLYPEYVDYDLKEEVVKYYDMFYHCELTDEQYDGLIKNSLK